MRKGERVGRLVRTDTPGETRKTASGVRRVVKYEMRCDCGTVFWVHVRCLHRRDGRSPQQSCGCLKAEREMDHGGLSGLNGGHHPLYYVWKDMIRRCYNEKHKAFKRYGGRGITVCPEWLSSFKAFYEWAEAKWVKGLELDRINNDGNYTTDNCRFITRQKNTNNRSTNITITAFGETKTISEWARDERCAVECPTLRARIKSKWEPEAAITAPSMLKHHTHENDGTPVSSGG